ncbi:unnamed protein product [Didymodactylos carnosus]|uniref:ODAD1 central coiled coil region domain-containing protein n=1 Tax=Didymodactylos carnosus TaxID=1234261 RepID=A0A815HLC9_9BILA|nr:unnamed protein product [Didymodactylos carnosus]CAF1353763.1 unnamed protein product [Didymodactylos carnosus]CAF3900362.1 unnamed protein product [Didymodactylos carnosus]CAF4225966.1 unnamed protein product [Didymodactylos carnosus]
MKLSLPEQIEEIRKKRELLAGCQEAFTEQVDLQTDKNKRKISQLQKENKEQRRKLKELLEGDEKVLNEAFSGRKDERAALKNKSGYIAIQLTDEQLGDLKNKLNSYRHQNTSKQKQLEELQTRYDQMVKDTDEAVRTDAGESETAARLRQLENRLDKAELKCTEAVTIQRTYNQIKSHLIQESLTYTNRLDAMEKQIHKTQEEFNEVERIATEAELAQKNAKNELKKSEDKVYRERKERELRLNGLKTEAEEKKMHTERADRRPLQRPTSPQEDVKDRLSEQDQTKIDMYEEAFSKIKEATGASTMQEVVERFSSQDETTAHLEKMKQEAEQNTAKLLEEKSRLSKEFEEMKYSGEAKTSTGQRFLENAQETLDNSEDRREKSVIKMEKTMKKMIEVKSGIEYLAAKLHHLKGTKSQVATTIISSQSNDYVLDLLGTTEEKLVKLVEELEAKDLQGTLRELRQQDLQLYSDGKLPQYNTRINPPSIQKGGALYGDDENAGEDNPEAMTRDRIKMNAEELIGLKTKRMKKPKSKK